MKKVAIFLCVLFFIFLAIYFLKNNAVVEVKSVISDNSSNISVKNIKEKGDLYDILTYFPETKYEVFNDYIYQFINSSIQEFKSMEKIPMDSGCKYLLEITFDEYEYDKYITYVFYTLENLCGAHPNVYIDSITYDTSQNKIFTIDDLILLNDDMLKNLSEISYNMLKVNEIFQNENMDKRLKDGTGMDKNNFKNFAFDKTGLKIFFENYQIAPYSAGDFSLIIPYEKLNLNF